MGTVTVITSGKGGVGKSTVTSCLGMALANRGRRVLLIDIDAGLGSLDYMLGVSQELVYDIADVVSGDCSIMKAIYRCGQFQGLYLLPAPRQIQDELSPSVMKQLVSVLSEYYDHILLDCPAGIGNGFQASVCCASRALLVSNPNPISLMDIQKVRSLLTNQEIEQMRLVINRFDQKTFQRTRLYDDLDQVIDETGVQLLAVIPEDCEMVASLVRGKVPDRNDPAMKAFERLAARMEGRRVPLPSLKKI